MTESLTAPAREPARTAPPPTTLVLFGATSELVRRRVMPALYNLAHDGMLPQPFDLIAVSRRKLGDDELRRRVTDSVRRFSRRPPQEAVLTRLLGGLRSVVGPPDDAAVHDRIGQMLAALDDRYDRPPNRAFYLCTPPELLPAVVERLGAAQLRSTSGSGVRLLVEKPFGTTLGEARALNAHVLGVFEESEVFRIDHYLGKEAVQNLLALRFANTLFEPIWNRNMIKSVQITAAEAIGVGSRVGYYDRAGAVRDLVQHHLLQLLSLVCMEPPRSLAADAVRDERVKVLKAIEPPRPEAAVRGRYAAGVILGRRVAGYLDEPGVPDDSTTETYAALRLAIRNPRWSGVPFYLRTGKRLARKKTEVTVSLRPVPHRVFREQGPTEVAPNQLILSLQPGGGTSITLAAKAPGAGMRIAPVLLELQNGAGLTSHGPDAYERLLLDGMRGNATLFPRGDEVEAQGRICDPIVQHWAADGTPPADYPAGSEGPVQADSLLAPGDTWRSV